MSEIKKAFSIDVAGMTPEEAEIRIKKILENFNEMPYIIVHSIPEYKLGDKVYHKADTAPFEVVGLRTNSIEIRGDWSGGTHNSVGDCWVKYGDIELYDGTKVRYYEKGKPFINGKPV